MGEGTGVLVGVGVAVGEGVAVGGGVGELVGVTVIAGPPVALAVLLPSVLEAEGVEVTATVIGATVAVGAVVAASSPQAASKKIRRDRPPTLCKVFPGLKVIVFGSLLSGPVRLSGLCSCFVLP